MKVCQVTPYFRPHVGGVESHVEALAGSLARLAVQVTVLTSRGKGEAREEKIGPVRVVRLPTFANLFMTPVSPGIARFLREDSFDIVHSHSPPPLSAYFASRARSRGRFKHVLTYHCDLEIPGPLGRLAVATYVASLGESTLRGADGVVATTKTYAETSRELWKRPDIEVIPNPVDCARFRPDLDGSALRDRLKLGNARVALFVGRLTHHKGVEDFVRSAAFTARDVVHVVVGDGPQKRALEGLARSTGVAHKFAFVGRADNHDLPLYYNLSDVVVLPSVSRLEAFGIATIEAHACGKPVVVSDIPGVREVITDGETGLVAQPFDPEDLAEKISRVLADAQKAKAMGVAARKHAIETYETGRVAKKVLGFYERLLERPAAITAAAPRT
ncbi:MAG: glycosyltransferase family 4 protein [Euryarchaeota archaeon]|nr:glycosyltransferase family 4 protein [Euryarchaeota archaeon]